MDCHEGSLEYRPLDLHEAEQIGKWRYSPPYDIYNMDQSDQKKKELLCGNFFAVYCANKTSLIGYFCVGLSAQVPGGGKIYRSLQTTACCDIGLGLDPTLTSRGRGTAFVGGVMLFSQEVYCARARTPDGRNQSFFWRLTVATFNERARRVYKKLGFSEQGKFIRPGATPMEFIVMVRSSTEEREK